MGLGHLDALDLTPSASTLTRRISSLSRLGARDIAPQTVSMDPKATREGPQGSFVPPLVLSEDAELHLQLF